MMKQIICAIQRILLIGVLMGFGTASVWCVMADNTDAILTVPGYHPDLFISGQGNAPIPAIEKSYESDFSLISDNSRQNLSFSVFPGDSAFGKKPSLVGFLSGGNIRAPVNIFGKTTGEGPFQYLTTVLPDEQGIFLWEIPENYKTNMDFQVRST
jgi:hypothetical protein